MDLYVSRVTDRLTSSRRCCQQSWGVPGGFNDLTNAEIKRLLADVFSDTTTDDVVWHYTPMSLGAVPDSFTPAMVIFDAMDELANFLGAPAGIAEREAELMRHASLVFTGGPSLYAQRQHAHPHVHCFPSGVDAVHFQPNPSRDVPPDSADWHSPLLGFYGVLDERIDFDLIVELAALRPHWTLSLIHI